MTDTVIVRRVGANEASALTQALASLAPTRRTITVSVIWFSSQPRRRW